MLVSADVEEMWMLWVVLWMLWIAWMFSALVLQWACFALSYHYWRPHALGMLFDVFTGCWIVVGCLHVAHGIAYVERNALTAQLDCKLSHGALASMYVLGL